MQERHGLINKQRQKTGIDVFLFLLGHLTTFVTGLKLIHGVDGGDSLKKCLSGFEW